MFSQSHEVSDGLIILHVATANIVRNQSLIFKKMHSTRAPKKQNRLKRLQPDGSAGGLVVIKM